MRQGGRGEAVESLTFLIYSRGILKTKLLWVICIINFIFHYESNTFIVENLEEKEAEKHPIIKDFFYALFILNLIALNCYKSHHLYNFVTVYFYLML